MRIGFLQEDPRVIVFAKTPVVDNYDLVTFKKMFEFMRHTDNGVVLEVLFDKISYEMIRFFVEASVIMLDFALFFTERSHLPASNLIHHHNRTRMRQCSCQNQKLTLPR